MKTIWKYDIQPNTPVSIPEDSQILTVQVQNQTPCLWVLVDPDAPVVTRHFNTYGTGHLILDDPGEYIGTFQLHDGAFVFHVFEVEQ